MNARFGLAYAVTLLAFLALDALWLSATYPTLYRPAIGHLLRDGFDPLAAAAFYALYILGVVVFAVSPGRAGGQTRAAMTRGSLFGLVAYGTYDLTNQATLRDWPWHVTLLDLVWGALVSALATGAACVALQWHARRRSARAR